MATPYERINNFIQDDVKRPDLQSVIDRRIQRALLKFHRKDNWKKDLIECRYVFPTANSAVVVQEITGGNSLFMNSMQQVGQLYIQQIDKEQLTRVRQFMYIRKWITADENGLAIFDPQSGTLGTSAGGDLTERSPDRMFDGYGGDLNDVFYESGQFVNIRSSTPLSQVFIGYFSDPVVEPAANIASWIATMYPMLIAAEVAWRVFLSIGKNEEAGGAKQERDEELLNLQGNNIRLALS
jgi:hypothetical protein